MHGFDALDWCAALVSNVNLFSYLLLQSLTLPALCWVHCRTSHEATSQGTPSAKVDHSSTPFSSGGGLNPNNILSGVMSSASAGTNYMLSGGSSSQRSAGGASGDYGEGSGGAVVRFSESAPQDKKTMLLFVVGGLSYTELAALRFLSNDPAFTYRIVIATTKLINGSTLINSLKHVL
jgi:hypothetical protein